MKQHFYIDRYNDEVLPCRPTLEEWAAWLARDDEACPHEIPADGDSFAVSTIEELGEVGATFRGGKWTLDAQPPADATSFVCRGGREGWDAETWSNEPLGWLAEAADEWGTFQEGETETVVCVRDGPSYQGRFDAAGPRLVLEPIQ